MLTDIIAVSVHTPEPPSDEDWDAYLADIVAQATAIRGVLVYTEKSGPSAPQRARSNEAFKQAGTEIPTAIMTSSTIVRGIVTALSWAVGSKVKAFSTHDFDGAAKYLELTNEEQLRVRVMLKQLARSAGVVVDAFADESGHFRRKYN